MQSDQTVSLRPGGGKGRPFGSRSGANVTGSVSVRPNSSSVIALSSSAGDVLGSNSRSQKLSTERIRYKREELYKYKEALQEIPQDLRAVISEIEAELGSLEEPDWARVTSATQVSPTVARYSETDTRNWKGRALPTSPSPEDRSRDGPKDAAKRSDNDWREKYQENEPSSYQAVRQQESSYSYRQHESSHLKQLDPITVNGPAPAIVRAVNPWSARRGEVTEKEKILRTVKGILNKLTPEKFEVLLSQLLNCGINSADILKGVISLVFDKAVLEPTFCPMYAELCVHLSQALPEFPSDEGDGKPVTFRRILLNSCQEEFEGADKMRAEVYQMMGSEQEADRFEKEKLIKLRTLGNIRLIGELFKLKMIPEKIVHHCIQMLLGQDPKAIPAEENLEALCQLFSTVGKRLDENPKSSPATESYFSHLQGISKNPRLPARIRFMIQNTMDTRANKWVPRREEVKAKTITEIHAEAEQKLGLRSGSTALRNARGASGATGMSGLGNNIPLARLGGVMPGMPGSLPGGGKVPFGATPMPNFLSGVDSDGWETIPSKNKNKIPREGSTPSLNAAPSRLVAQPPGSQLTTASSKFLSQGSGGRFHGRPSALLGESIPSTVLPVSKRNEGVLEPLNKVKTPEKERPPAIFKQVAAPALNIEALEKKSKSLLEEFLSVGDFNEAKLCLEELQNKDFYPQFVQMAILVLLEAKDRQRDLVGNLLVYLWSKRVLATKDIVSGVTMVTEQLDDLRYDIPLAPKYIGSLVGKLFASEMVEVGLLCDILEQAGDLRQKNMIYDAAQAAVQAAGNAEKIVAELRECEKLLKGA
ncbi:hypothetical protein KP509_12G010900 [Ceratopteris richardii]|uniref:MI domain-containing protein n=1 Tax=Ceratopteris richardii TaxID=49495 RepID=A0A8T2TJ44_CERRI|nr:hypothetical protein KP509_12G010900 [Ceratopteris richardii]KAH7422490.1 hypothetical protein KP509_12G010900 [Ceratopteris richardii]KAH7422492.1 hypothetical protein KP509_12G010900 [Ceratopteris richardii]